jgi:hypothetical protein
MAKYASTILAAALVAALAACGAEGEDDETDPTPAVPPVVYSAGVTNPNSNFLGTATVWKGETPIKQVPGLGTFASVCVSDGVVHAVGAVQDGASIRPYYWRSPDAGGPLPIVGAYGSAMAVCVQGGHVYVAGLDAGVGKVWKDGAPLYTLSDTPDSSGYRPYSIAVDPDGYVLTAGEDDYGAAIWENNYFLEGLDEADGFFYSRFYSVDSSGAVAFAAGTSNDRPVWMKEGGVPNTLGTADGEATSLHLPGDGYLYVAFTDESPSMPGSRVYKGLASGVTIATQAASVIGSRIESVFVLGGDVYSGGAQASADGSSFNGGVWINSNSTRHLSLGANSIANSIYVVPAPK